MSAASRGDATGFPSLSVLLTLTTLLAFALRVQRMAWQPLWWDEGYSVFFATEPLARMLALTAKDIHPPLYYAALHGWIALLDDARPAVTRLFSIGAGTVAAPLLGALVSRLTHRSLIAALTASFLLAVNPMHIYYSQEIRMYSLAASMGLASTLCLVIWVDEARSGRMALNWLVAFVALSVLFLHTLYYAAILVAVQFAWAAWRLRDDRRKCRGGEPSGPGALAAGAVAVILLSLPWWAFAAPKLSAYVANKVQSDQDVSLGFIDYLLRHFVAFTAGHVQPAEVSRSVVLAAGILALLPLAMTMRSMRGNRPGKWAPTGLDAAVGLLSASFVGALLFGFAVNLRFPFFPEGGERLLLFALPYFLALIALGLQGRSALLARIALLTPFLLVSVAGTVSYYTQPRHAENDYRPVVSHVQQWGSDSDTVLAIFPWQVGYWRAYGQRDDAGDLIAPQPASVGQDIMVWNDSLRRRIDTALADGTIWFPEPLALGSTLPYEIEEYLTQNALNVDNRWETAATRLTAWSRRPQKIDLLPRSVDFGAVSLTGSRIWPQTVASDNSVLNVGLRWRAQRAPQSLPPDDRVTLKLQDSEGRVWAERDYRPPGQFDFSSNRDAGELVDLFGMAVPAGMPPGVYTVTLSVLDGDGVPYAAQSDDNTDPAHAVALQEITVVAPPDPISPVRVPVDHRIDGAGQNTDVAILGVAGVGGPEGSPPTALAGADLETQVVLQNQSETAKQYAISVALLDRDGTSVAAWEGWPLPDYPTQQWPQGAITRVPVTLQIPAEVDSGTYSLVAGLVERREREPSGRGMRFPPQVLTEVKVYARDGNFKPIVSAIPLPTPVQFGTHARLLGYDVAFDGESARLSLDWQALQPLLPPHHIFIHVTDAQGNLIAQQDGPPMTEEGPAPTGSWRAGEYITTQHSIALPQKALADELLGQLEFRVGLYDPKSGARLPSFLDDEPAGDSAVLLIEP